MVQLTLDAGVLIGAQRNDRLVWGLLDAAFRRGQVLTVPTVVLTQVWRGSRSARLAQFLTSCNIEPLDEALAKAAGVLCATAGTSDAVDAIVVASAARRGNVVITSDPDDLLRLASAAPAVVVRAL